MAQITDLPAALGHYRIIRKFLVLGALFAVGVIPPETGGVPPVEGKRSEPTIMLPDEWAVAVAHLPLRSLIFNEKKDIMLVVVEANGVKGNFAVPPKNGGLQKSLKNSGCGMAKGPGGNVGEQQSATDYQKGNLRIVPVDEVDGKKGVRLAYKVLPVRTATVVGSFPMRKQFREYVEKLRLRSLSALLAEPTLVPQFEEILVRRVVIGPNGKPDGEAVDIEIGAQMTELLVLTNRKIDPDDKKLTNLMFDGLVMPRPALIHLQDKGYPRIDYPGAETKLAKLNKTLTEMAHKGSATQSDALTLPHTLADSKGINPFTPSGAAKKPAEPKPPDNVPPPDAGEKALGFDAIPEYCLLRFIDTDLVPGKTYEYQIKLKARNPNYKQKDSVVVSEKVAENEFIYSGGSADKDWYTIPRRVYVPQEFQFFVIDQKAAGSGSAPTVVARDQVVFQVHCWIDTFFPDPARSEPGSRMTAGDWVIWERQAFYRGASIKGQQNLEVLSYNSVSDSFNLVRNPRDGRFLVPVTLGPPGDGEAALVNFEGGKVRAKKSDAPNGFVTLDVPTEVLVVGPDGKLLAHNSNADLLNKERQERVSYVRKKIEAAKQEYRQR